MDLEGIVSKRIGSNPNFERRSFTADKGKKYNRRERQIPRRE